jgi:hypothetical protein
MTVVIGAAAGGLVAVLAVIVLVFVLRRKRGDAEDGGNDNVEFSLVSDTTNPEYGTQVADLDFLNPITVANEGGMARSLDANLEDDDDRGLGKRTISLFFLMWIKISRTPSDGRQPFLRKIRQTWQLLLCLLFCLWNIAFDPILRWFPRPILHSSLSLFYS